MFQLWIRVCERSLADLRPAWSEACEDRKAKSRPRPQGWQQLRRVELRSARTGMSPWKVVLPYWSGDVPDLWASATLMLWAPERHDTVVNPRSRGALRNAYSGGFCTEQDAFSRNLKGVPDASYGVSSEALRELSTLCNHTALLTHADVACSLLAERATESASGRAPLTGIPCTRIQGKQPPPS
eukprot:3684925-Amphidinium_carterae.2